MQGVGSQEEAPTLQLGEPLEHLGVGDAVAELGAEAQAHGHRRDGQAGGGAQRGEVLGGSADGTLVTPKRQVDAAIHKYEQIDPQPLDQATEGLAERSDSHLAQRPYRLPVPLGLLEPAGEPSLRTVAVG